MKPHPVITIDTLYREHLGFVRWVVAQRGVPAADLDDVAHQALICAGRALHRFDPSVGGLRPWLAKIARDCAVDHLRQCEPATLCGGNHGFIDPRPTPEQTLMTNRALREIVDGIAPKRREVFLYHELRGMSDAEVAEVLSIPEGTVKSRLRLAWEDIRAKLKRQRGRRGAVLPINIAALLDHERSAFNAAPEDAIERTQEPRMPSPRQTLDWVGPFVVGGAIGAIVVYLLLARQHRYEPTPVCQGSSIAVAEPGGPPTDASAGVSAAPASTMTASAVTPAPSPKSVACPIPSLDAEEIMMRTARAALARGDLDAARTSLERHARQFPQGRLSQQREALLAAVVH